MENMLKSAPEPNYKISSLIPYLIRQPLEVARRGLLNSYVVPKRGDSTPSSTIHEEDFGRTTLGLDFGHFCEKNITLLPKPGRR